MKSELYQLLKVLWDYMKLDQTVEPGDCIIGFGCINDHIALRCAQLYHQGFAPKVLFTGGLGRNTLGRWAEPEAERFAHIAIKEGVPREAILLENKSTNSAENILFTRTLLEQEGLAGGKLICVHKPFMERRLYAAMKNYWPEANACYTSPQLSMEEYIQVTVEQGISEQGVIDVLVGDFQRMHIYATRGYQIPQDIPQTAWDAFHKLVELGCIGELVSE